MKNKANFEVCLRDLGIFWSKQELEFAEAIRPLDELITQLLVCGFSSISLIKISWSNIYYSQPQKEYIEDVTAGLIDYKNYVLHFGPNKVNIMTDWVPGI